MCRLWIIRSSFRSSPRSLTVSYTIVKSTRVTPTSCLCSKPTSISLVSSVTWSVVDRPQVIQLVWAGVLNLLLDWVPKIINFWWVSTLITTERWAGSSWPCAQAFLTSRWRWCWPAPDLWNCLAGYAFNAEIPQPVQHYKATVGDKLGHDVIWALCFTIHELADNHFHLLIGEAVESDLSVFGLCRRAAISWLIFLLISWSTLLCCPFSIRTLAIAFALTGLSGVFFTWPVRWLKVCNVFLLKWVKLIGDVEISHLSLCFVLRISESFVDLEDCGGMVGCCASIIYLFSFYLISFHLFLHFIFFCSRIFKPIVHFW